MVVEIIGTPTTSTTSAGTTLTINKPATLRNGDYLVAHVCCSNDETITGPSGWTQYTNSQHNQSSGDDRCEGVWYKKIVAAALEAANYAWTTVGTINLSGGIVVVRGVDLNQPEDCAVQVTDAANTPDPVCPSITTVTENTLVLCCGVVTNTVTTVNAPTGTTKLWGTETSLAGATSLCCYYIWNAASATGTRTIDTDAAAASEASCLQVAFRARTVFRSPTLPSGGSHKVFLVLSGQLDYHSGMRATSATPKSWIWAPFSSSSNYYYPSGSITRWMWVSGNYQQTDWA